MNKLFIQGRVPFAPNHFPAKDETKKSFATFMVSVSTGQKDEDTGYYKEDMFKCKVVGQQADVIAENWCKGYTIAFDGRLTMGNDYTDKEGNLVKGQPEIFVNRIHTFNTLDSTMYRGKVPFEIKYTPGDGDKKKSFAMFTMTVSTGQKDEETGYYKEKQIRCKAFGYPADHLNKYYTLQDFVTLEGRFVEGTPYDKDGVEVNPGLELIVDKVHGFGTKGKDASNTTKTSSAPSKPSTPNKPSTPTKPSSPSKPNKPAAPKPPVR